MAGTKDKARKSRPTQSKQQRAGTQAIRRQAHTKARGARKQARRDGKS